MAYLCGADPGRSERLMALVLRPGVPSAFVTPAFEEERVRREAVVERTVVWQEEEDPLHLLATLLRGAKRIGIEGTTDFHTAARLREATGARAAGGSSANAGRSGVATRAEAEPTKRQRENGRLIGGEADRASARSVMTRTSHRRS